MDYKYIEQLLDRYWEAETTIAEEHILRNFFSQPITAIPEHLRKYRPLFDTFVQEQVKKPSPSLEEKILLRYKELEPKRVKAQRGNPFFSLRSLYKAAACIGTIMLVGIGAQYSFTNNNIGAWDYNPNSYNDSYHSEQEAYKVTKKSLQLFEETASADTMFQHTSTKEEKE